MINISYPLRILPLTDWLVVFNIRFSNVGNITLAVSEGFLAAMEKLVYIMQELYNNRGGNYYE